MNTDKVDIRLLIRKLLIELLSSWEIMTKNLTKTGSNPKGFFYLIKNSHGTKIILSFIVKIEKFKLKLPELKFKTQF